MNFIQGVPNSKSAFEFDTYKKSIYDKDTKLLIYKCLPQLYELLSKGGDMYIGSSEFTYKDKDHVYDVMGYRYQGVFYNAL